MDKNAEVVSVDDPDALGKAFALARREEIVKVLRDDVKVQFGKIDVTWEVPFLWTSIGNGSMLAGKGDEEGELHFTKIEVLRGEERKKVEAFFERS